MLVDPSYNCNSLLSTIERLLRVVLNHWSQCVIQLTTETSRANLRDVRRAQRGERGYQIETVNVDHLTEPTHDFLAPRDPTRGDLWVIVLFLSYFMHLTSEKHTEWRRVRSQSCTGFCVETTSLFSSPTKAGWSNRQIELGNPNSTPFWDGVQIWAKSHEKRSRNLDFTKSRQNHSVP